MKKIVLTLAAVAAIGAGATQYSKLGIITAAKERGRWQALKAWIAAADYEDEWQACSYLSDDYPQFAAITNAVVAQGVMTPEDVAAVMESSVDTAVPDAYMRFRYDKDMKGSEGRKAWHGKLVSQTVDTNALVRIQVYEDGARFVDPYTPPRPITLPATNNVPARLAAARLKRAKEAATTNTVTVIVNKAE